MVDFATVWLQRWHETVDSVINMVTLVAVVARGGQSGNDSSNCKEQHKKQAAAQNSCEYTTTARNSNRNNTASLPAVNSSNNGNKARKMRKIPHPHLLLILHRSHNGCIATLRACMFPFNMGYYNYIISFNLSVIHHSTQPFHRQQLAISLRLA